MWKGTLKISGSHSWSATRKWMVQRGYASFGEPLHHWLISQATAAKYGLQSIANQPWNLIKFADQSSHMRFAHGQTYMGVEGAGTLGQLWYGTPTWFKNFTFGTGGDLIK